MYVRKHITASETAALKHRRTSLKGYFRLSVYLLTRREAKTRIRQYFWLKLLGEKIRREQVGTVPTFLLFGANKFAKWKTGLRPRLHGTAHAHTMCMIDIGSEISQFDNNNTCVSCFWWKSLLVFDFLALKGIQILVPTLVLAA